MFFRHSDNNSYPKRILHDLYHVLRPPELTRNRFRRFMKRIEILKRR